jgi:hypothetical protein
MIGQVGNLILFDLMVWFRFAMSDSNRQMHGMAVWEDMHCALAAPPLLGIMCLPQAMSVLL